MSSDDGIRHEELLAAAREAGLDPSAVEAAATELAAGETHRQALARVTAAEIKKRRRRFQNGAVGWSLFAMFSALAYFVLGTATGAAWPFVTPALVWGFFVALAGVRALTSPDPDAMERRVVKEQRAAERERAKQRAKETAEAWARKLQEEIAGRRSRSDVRKQKALELEDAIEDGVRAVLHRASTRGLGAVDADVRASILEAHINGRAAWAATGSRTRRRQIQRALRSIDPVRSQDG